MNDRRHRLSASALLARTALLLLGTALMLGLAATATRLSARDDAWSPPSQTPSDDPVPGRAQLQESEPTLRMSFFNATWEDVLEHVAEETNSELVLHDAPEGRFSRVDHRKYTRAEALRIVNRELEPMGYRVLPKGRFLAVLHDDRIRPRYPAPEVPTEAAPQATGPEVDGAAARAPRRSATPGPMPAPAPAIEVAPQPVGDSVEGPQLRSVPVALRDGRVTHVARALHEAHGERSELVDRGPNGLPAMRVRRPLLDGRGEPTEGERRFVVELDVDRNVLLVSALEAEAPRVAKGVRRLEAALAGGAARVVPAGSETARIAKRLGPWLRHFSSRGKEPARQLAWQPPPRAEEPAAPPPQGEPREDGTDDEATAVTDLPSLVGTLKGDVTIEAVEDLGVVILRGNEADVEAVMSVIRQLELLSRGTTPDILLLELQHLDGVALAALLNDVYGQLDAMRQRVAQADRRTVSVIPVVRPNAVLVLAPEAMMESIRKLAEELDQPVDPRSQVQIFRLRSAVPSQIVAVVDDFYADRGGLGTRVQVAPDPRTNSVIVQAQPNDLAEITRLIREIDRPRSRAVSRMRIFPLKNAVAEELAEVINLTLGAATGDQPIAGAGLPGGATGAAAQQLREARSVVLEFLAVEDEVARRVRSGLLVDVVVTADPRTNSLLVTAPEPSMDLMGVLVQQLDQPAEAVAEIKVFTLENADATATAALLDNLFPTAEGDGPQGVQLAGAVDAGSGLVPLRFSVDVRTNSILAVGGAEALRVVEAIVLRLDESDARQRRSTVVRLKNSPVADVAAAINDFLTSQRELAQVDPALVSNVELLEREVIVVPEPVSNSLLISATPRYFEEIHALVERLDAAPAQVVIQALLVEVELDNTDELGVELGFQDDVLFGRSLIEDVVTVAQTNTAPNGVQTTTQQVISQTGQPGFLFANPNAPLGNNVSPGTRPSAVGTQGLSNFSLGRANADLGFGGLVLSASSASVNVLVRALAARRNVHILSRPQIRTLDNQLAQIQVGQSVPIVQGGNLNDLGTFQPVINYDDAGIILTVTPRISPDGDIVMEVAAEKSQYDLGAGIPIFTDPSTGTSVTSPVKDITTALTTVSVPNGQTVVLGGMITKNDATLARKVPWLGDLPIVGQIFRYDSTRSQRTELLIFLTPRVVANDADGEIIKQIEAGRLHYIEEEAEAIHGPLFAVPPAAGPAPFPATGTGPFPPPDVETPTTVMPIGPLPHEPVPPFPAPGQRPPIPPGPQPLPPGLRDPSPAPQP